MTKPFPGTNTGAEEEAEDEAEEEDEEAGGLPVLLAARRAF
jgi:hypothetical protein